MRRTRPLVLLLATAIAGCSSETTNEGKATGGATGGGGAGGSAGASQCSQKPGGPDCFDCCATEHSSGFQQFLTLLRPKVCDDKACDVPCEEGVCVDSGAQSLSLACKPCLAAQAMSDMVPGCFGTFDCKAWVDCYQKCAQ